MPTKFGVLDTRDLEQTVATTGQASLAAAIREYLDYYNAALNSFLGLYAIRTTEYTERYYSGAEAGRLRPSDQYGRGLISRAPDPTYFDVAYPIDQWDDRLGWTALFMSYATGQQINDEFIASQERDKNTLMAALFTSLFFKANYTWEDENHGTLSIKRLLNADGTVPPRWRSNSFSGSHQHYLGTDGAVDYDFLVSVYEHLREHGYGSDVVLEVAPDVGTTISELDEFYEAQDTVDPRINFSNADTPTTATVTNNRAIGRIANMEVRVNEDFQDGYGFATDVDGEPPIAMREDPIDALRGFRIMNDTPSDQFPLTNAYMVRRAGFGIRNRVNGVCFSVNASTTYDDPAEF